MTAKPYESYKPVACSWLRTVPKRWDFLPGKRLFERKKHLNTGMKCLERLALTMAGVVPRALDDVEGLQASDFETYQIFNPGDLAFKLIDLQNIKTSRVGLVPERGIMSPAYIRIAKRRTTLNERYFYWQYYSLYLQNIFNGLGGGVRQTLGSEELLDMPLCVPSYDEQKTIAVFLDRETAKIDRLIEKQERLITLLEEKRQAVISYAVTKGLNPDAPMKDSGIDWLGEVPKSWTLLPLKYTAKFSSGGTPSKDEPRFWDGDIPWVTPKDMKQAQVSDAKINVTPDALNETGLKLVPVGTILMVVRGLILARHVPVTETLEPVTINQDMKALRFGPGISPAFANYYFQGTNQHLKALAEETGHGTKALRMELLSQFPFCCPPEDEQTAIVRRLNKITDTLENVISKAKGLVEKLSQRRSSIISAAVTGKMDVRGLVQMEEDEAA